MEVDEITRTFHEASKYRNDHLRKAIGCFQENTLTDDALEKARSKNGRYANTPENRKLGRVGLPYEKPTFERIVLPSKPTWGYTVDDFNSGHRVSVSDLGHGDKIIVHVKNRYGCHSYSVGAIIKHLEGDEFEVKIDGSRSKVGGGKFVDPVKVGDIRLLRKVSAPSPAEEAKRANRVRSKENSQSGSYGAKVSVADLPASRTLRSNGTWGTEHDGDDD